MNDEDVLTRLKSAPKARFAPGFADRVMARVLSEREVPPASLFARALRRRFVRAVPVALAASIALVVWSAAGAHGTGRPLLDVVLGLPPVVLEDAYTLSPLAILEEIEVVP